ncbi:MAG: hypothetical protein L3J03_03070 [Desulfobacterales bacterium]|nr:hypothetical protein [Desulfobacterales bacterium]
MMASPRTSLLLPFGRGLCNRFFPGNTLPLRTILALATGLAVCLALYLTAVRVVTYFHSQNELGIILSLKIFQMAWITVFAMLIFSCMVSAVSTLFLSQDNEIVGAAPVTPEELYFMRYLTTTVYTSWMMVIFSLPIFAAYGRVFHAGVLYAPLMLLAVVATAAIASALGMALTVVLVNLFPARRTKDIIFYLSLCFGIFIYVMFRLLRPEDLVNPDKYAHFLDYLASIANPAAPYLPAAWAANLLSLYLLDREVDWLLTALLVFTPPALFFIGEWAMGRWFFSGYSKSQESFGGFRSFPAPGRYRPAVWRWIFRKESKLFLRDSAEWSQLFMIAALIVVYLYNFKLLPLDRAPIREEYIANLIAFLNIGLTGFVVASLSARFVYPSVGAEGGSFYLIRAAPLSMRRYLLAKYFFYVIPFTGLALLLLAASNQLLKIKGPMAWICLASGLVITWTLVALALGFGSLYADFKAENRAAALGGMGAILFLFTALAFILLIILLGALPTYRLVTAGLAGSMFRARDLLLLVAWIGGSIFLAVGLALFVLQKGIKRLEESG